MLEIKIDDAKYWRDCVDSIVSLVDEGAFNVSKDGISFRAMDPSGISMVSFFIPSKAFSKFSVEKPVNIGLNLENLSKILSRTRDAEALVMKENENKLTLEFIGANSKRRYKLQLIDVKKGSDKEPNVTFDSSIEISVDPFKDILKDAGLMSSYVQFKAQKGQFGIMARGDSGELEELHENDGNILKKVEGEKVAESTFNLEFLEHMVRSCPSGNSVNINLKSNEPLRLNYSIGEAQVTYYLAPYMEG